MVHHAPTAVSSIPGQVMRIFSTIVLLSLAAVPVGAQGIVVPVRCHGACAVDGGQARAIAMDSVQVWAYLERGAATTHVDHQFRNTTADTVDAAFFFPVPADVTLTSISVYRGGELVRYNEWSGPEESRWIVEGLLREQPRSALRAYAGVTLVHVPVGALPPHGTVDLQISYSQPVLAENGTHTYRYPLSAGAGTAPVGHLAIGAEVTTETGFRDLHSPTHEIRVEWGTEAGRCRPTARCGFTNVPSQRVKVVRMEAGRGDRTRDFEIVYTVADPAAERRNASIP
jgi:hypothetical protein